MGEIKGLCLILAASGSMITANKGERGQPWQVPRWTANGEEIFWLVITDAVGREYIISIHFMKEGWNPNFLSTDIMLGHATWSNTCCASSEITNASLECLAYICLPGIQPVWSGCGSVTYTRKKVFFQKFQTGIKMFDFCSTYSHLCRNICCFLDFQLESELCDVVLVPKIVIWCDIKIIVYKLKMDYTFLNLLTLSKSFIITKLWSIIV